MKDFKPAGAFGFEVKCIAAKAATQIGACTAILTISQSLGGGRHAQYLTAVDLTAKNSGPIPCRAKIYVHFGAQLDWRQRERAVPLTTVTLGKLKKLDMT